MLEVRIAIKPPPSNPHELDNELDKELLKFEEYYTKKMSEAGYAAAGFMTAERVVVKSYLIWAMNERNEDA